MIFVFTITITIILINNDNITWFFFSGIRWFMKMWSVFNFSSKAPLYDLFFPICKLGFKNFVYNEQNSHQILAWTCFSLGLKFLSYATGSLLLLLRHKPYRNNFTIFRKIIPSQKSRFKKVFISIRSFCWYTIWYKKIVSFPVLVIFRMCRKHGHPKGRAKRNNYLISLI